MNIGIDLASILAPLWHSTSLFFADLFFDVFWYTLLIDFGSKQGPILAPLWHQTPCFLMLVLLIIFLDGFLFILIKHGHLLGLLFGSVLIVWDLFFDSF